MQADSGQHDDWPALLDGHIREKSEFYYHLAYGVLRSDEEAADVCQQAFLRAWERREQIRRRESLGKWLARVVMNESYGRLRQGQSEQRMRARRADASHDAPGHAELIERRDLVVSALKQLPEPIREVVTLRTMQGMSGNDVGELLEISRSDVSRRLHEGLEQLRRFLDDGQRPGD
jgi:RNA polymerase sigma-70 factor, ECF subfamily